MLKCKYLYENYDLAKEALSHWKHDEDTLEEMLSRFRISSNAIYPFCRDGGVCFLRLAPLEEKLEKNVLGELEFIEYLLANGYPALEPVRADTGETCLKLRTQWGDYYAAAFRKVDGVQIDDTAMSNEIMYAYGSALGRLHTLSAQFTPTVRKWTHIEALDWIGSVLSEYGAPAVSAAELDSLRNELGKLPKNSGNYGLIHYDFEPDNVFYDEDTKKCSVIDFDDGMYHWFALDIEQAFDALAEEVDEEALQQAKEHFIAGYKARHVYTDEMEEALPLMRRFVNLFSYARLLRCVADKCPGEPEWLLELRIKLNAKMKRIEAGFTR